jgi:NitT/TauT family transport system permease protein
MKIKTLFELRGTLDKKTNLAIGLAGFVFLLSIWSFIASTNWIPQQILPSPWKVLLSFKELHFKDALVRNAGFSIYLNFVGYIEAIIVSLFAGFVMGLFPLFRSLFSRYINAIRFIPLNAVTGIFIAWFGIYNGFKINFLAAGIIVYLIPVVIQRIDEVETVYDQTAITLGASMWQRIWKVYRPYVMSKISDDIRVLTAISWTYIIIAENINAVGGLGTLSYLAVRQSRVDKALAVLLIYILIGFLQDRLFLTIDHLCFKHKKVKA